jgi:hypothetical protein
MMIYLLKLKNGTEVIGSTDQDAVGKAGVELTDPFQINYRFVSGQPMPTISVSRYIPFAAEPIHFFKAEDISHATVPSNSFIEYYQSSLEYVKDTIDKGVDEDLHSIAEKSRSEKRDISDIYMSILERTQQDGPLN